MKITNKKTKEYDMTMEVDGYKFGLRSVFDPDKGTPYGDVNVYDWETGRLLGEIPQVSIPEEEDEDSRDLIRIRNHIADIIERL